MNAACLNKKRRRAARGLFSINICCALWRDKWAHLFERVFWLFLLSKVGLGGIDCIEKRGIKMP